MDENSTMQRSSISQAATLDEMAEFWDTHDTAEYWDQFEEVEVNVRMQPRHRVVIDPEQRSS